MLMTLTYEIKQQTHENGTVVEQKLRIEAAKLFGYYARTYNETLDPVRLFWGLLYEIIVTFHLLWMERFSR